MNKHIRRFPKSTVSGGFYGLNIFLFCVFSLLYSLTSNAQTSPPDPQQIGDTMVRLCVGGGQTQATSGGGTGGADLSLRSLDVKGNLKGEFKVSRSSAEGLVNGIDNALSQVAAEQADKVRLCLQPVRERLLDLLLPPQKQGSTRGDGLLLTAAKPLSSDRMNQYIGYVLPERPYFIFANVSVKFREDTYNTDIVYRSFDSFTFSLMRAGDRNNWIEEPANTIESTRSGNSFLVKINLEAPPQAGDRIRIKAGSVVLETEAKVDTFSWQDTIVKTSGREIPLRISYIDANFDITHPNWLILTDAEIVKGNQDLYVVRATIINPTEQAENLIRVNFGATKMNRSHVMCATGDPVQQITLKWDVIAGPSVTTELSGVEIPLRVEYNPRGMCDPFWFATSAPTAQNVPPRSTTQIGFRIKELPPMGSDSSQDINGFGISGPPPDRPPSLYSLSSWDSFRLSLKAAGTAVVKPDVVNVKAPDPEYNSLLDHFVDQLMPPPVPNSETSRNSDRNAPRHPSDRSGH